jgi:hypothetical protein
MNNFTKFTAALLVLMNLAILITVIGFLLLAVGVVPGRHRYVTLNVTTRKSESVSSIITTPALPRAENSNSENVTG